MLKGTSFSSGKRIFDRYLSIIHGFYNHFRSIHNSTILELGRIKCEFLINIYQKYVFLIKNMYLKHNRPKKPHYWKKEFSPFFDPPGIAHSTP